MDPRTGLIIHESHETIEKMDALPERWMLTKGMSTKFC